MRRPRRGDRLFTGDLGFGSATLRVHGRPAVVVGRGDAVAVTGGVDHVLAGCSADLELVEVWVP